MQVIIEVKDNLLLSLSACALAIADASDFGSLVKVINYPI